MSDRKLAESRVIHSRALAAWGEATCFAAIEVARDLRSGVIPPEEYDQGSFYRIGCGSACCIAGHIAWRMREPVERLLKRTGYWGAAVPFMLVKSPTDRLFAASRPSNPQLAADAIERFVFDGSDDPWMP